MFANKAYLHQYEAAMGTGTEGGAGGGVSEDFTDAFRNLGHIIENYRHLS